MITILTVVVADGSVPAGTIVPLEPFTQPIEIPRGEDAVIRLKIRKADGSRFALTGWDIRLAVRRQLADASAMFTRVATLVQPPDLEDDPQWDAEVELDQADTLGLIEKKKYHFDVQLTDTDDNRWQGVPDSVFHVLPIVGQVAEPILPPLVDEGAPIAIGPPGAAGLSILNGIGPPDDSLGRDGEWYVDHTDPEALVIYGPKDAGAWGVGYPFGSGADVSSEDPLPLGVADPGVGPEAAAWDHVHAHGDQAGGSLHAVAIAGGAAGFMSGTQATELADALTDIAANTAAIAGNSNDISDLQGIVLGAGAGLTGGGDLTGDRAFAVGQNADASIVVNADDIQLSPTLQTAISTNTSDIASLAGTVAAVSAVASAAVPASRTLTPGAGLAGSAPVDLSADRTFAVGANADGSIAVNADDIQVGVLATDAQHGNRGGGGLHADVVASGASGFMTGAQAAQLVTNTTAIGTLTTAVATDAARIATWSDCRYWFVDYDGGSDANTGFIDATAGTTFTGGQLAGVPFKTLERFFAVCPKLGSGKRFVLLVKPRASAAAYLKADGVTADSIDWTGFVGYRTRLSRASTDLTNSVTDRILCGFTQAITGPGAGGSYLALAGATTSSLTVTGTPFTTNALAGWRVRFLGDVTAGLANICVNIRDNTTSQLNFGDTVTVPATNDSFVIEKPGVPVWQYLSNDIATGQTYGDPSLNTPISGEAPTECCDVGFEVRSTTNLAYQMTGTGFKACCGIETSDVTLSLATSTQFHIADMHRAAIRKSYVDETGVSRLVGMGARVRNGWLIDRITCLEAAEAFAWVNANGGIGAIPPRLVDITCIGTGGIFNKGSFLGSRWRFLNIGMGGNGANQSIFPGTVIGGGTTGIRSRSVNSIAPNASNVAIQGWEFSDCSQNCIQANNGGAMRGCSLAIDNCIGTTNNLGFGIDVTGLLGCSIFLGTGAANTMAGTSGDITLPGGATTTHASFVTIGYKDQQGNTYYGSFTNTMSDQAMLFTNVDGTALALGEVVRKTATTTQVVRAKADTAANASGGLYVAVTPPANNAAGYFVAMNAPQKWVLHNAAPTLAALSYLSAATGGLATTTAIAVAGTNQKRRLGHVVKVSGSLGLVTGSPEMVPVTSDGLA